LPRSGTFRPRRRFFFTTDEADPQPQPPPNRFAWVPFGRRRAAYVPRAAFRLYDAGPKTFAALFSFCSSLAKSRSLVRWAGVRAAARLQSELADVGPIPESPRDGLRVVDQARVNLVERVERSKTQSKSSRKMRKDGFRAALYPILTRFFFSRWVAAVNKPCA